MRVTLGSIGLMMVLTSTCAAEVQIFEPLHGHGFVEVARAQRGSVMPGVDPRVACIAPLPTGGVLVADSRLRESVWRVGVGDSEVAFEVPEDAGRVLSMAVYDGFVFVGTESDLLVSEEGRPARKMRFVLRQGFGTIMFTGPGTLDRPVDQIATDHAGNVWVRTTGRMGGIYTFPADRERWRTNFADQPLDTPLPPLYDLAFGVDPMALTAGERAFACFSRDGRRPQLLVPELPAQHMTEPLPARDQVPALVRPVLAATDGALWLAGEANGGPMVLRIADDGVDFLAPPGDLVGRALITDLAVSENRVFVATDTGGVLVLDEDGWRVHPVNEHIMPMRDMSLCGAQQVVVDGVGDLWVSSNQTLLRWTQP